MYLLSKEIHNSWYRYTSSLINPSIPISAIERLALPANIILPKRPKKGFSPGKLGQPYFYSEQIIAEFEERQANLVKLSELQKNMTDGVERAWDLAWMNMLGDDQE